MENMKHIKSINKFYENYHTDGPVDSGDSIKRDFNTTVWDATEKRVIGAYFLLGETPTQYTLLNIVESVDKTKRKIDGTLFFHLDPKIFTINKNRGIEKCEGVVDKPGFWWFKLSYPLFKNSDDLKIKRIDTSDKLFDFGGHQVAFRDIMEPVKKIFTDQRVVDFIKSYYQESVIKTLRGYFIEYRN